MEKEALFTAVENWIMAPKSDLKGGLRVALIAFTLVTLVFLWLLGIISLWKINPFLSIMMFTVVVYPLVKWIIKD